MKGCEKGWENDLKWCVNNKVSALSAFLSMHDLNFMTYAKFCFFSTWII